MEGFKVKRQRRNLTGTDAVSEFVAICYGFLSGAFSALQNNLGQLRKAIELENDIKDLPCVADFIREVQRFDLIRRTWDRVWRDYNSSTLRVNISAYRSRYQQTVEEVDQYVKTLRRRGVAIDSINNAVVLREFLISVTPIFRTLEQHLWNGIFQIEGAVSKPQGTHGILDKEELLTWVRANSWQEFHGEGRLVFIIYPVLREYWRLVAPTPQAASATSRIEYEYGNTCSGPLYKLLRRFLRARRLLVKISDSPKSKLPIKSRPASNRRKN